MPEDESFSMLQELCLRYEFARNPDRSATVTIDIDARFADLWLVKLTDLRATVSEIAEHEPR